MFWPSSSTYTGYGKGKYSLALPAGTACIGLMMLAVALIMALGFPNIVTDWTKIEMCIVNTEHEKYKTWSNELSQTTTINISIWNFTNALDANNAGEEPQFAILGPYNFTQKSWKTNIEFMEDRGANRIDRVTFKKNNEFFADFSRQQPGAVEATLPNLFLLRQFWKLRDANVDIGDLSSNMIEIMSIFNEENKSDPTKFMDFWLKLISSSQATCDFPSKSACERFSFFQWLKRTSKTNEANYFLNSTSQVNLLTSILEEIFNFTQFKDENSDDGCVSSKRLAQLFSTRADNYCTSCLNEISFLKFLIVRRQLMYGSNSNIVYSKLRTCVKNNSIFRDFPRYKDDEWENVWQIFNDYFLDYFRRIILLELVVQGRFLTTENIFDLSVGKSENSILGVAPAIFGSDEHLYTWRTCVVRWHVNSDANFEWLELDGAPVRWHAKSDYAIPPPHHTKPCLNPPINSHLTVMMEGFWTPAVFKYRNSETLYGKTVYVYELESSLVPPDNIFGSMLTTYVNVSDVVKFPALLSPVCSSTMEWQKNVSMTDVCRAVLATIKIEPYTGAILETNLDILLNVVIPEEFFQVANISKRFYNNVVPVARVTRKTIVDSSFTKFLDEISPMLAITCAGVTVMSLLSAIFAATTVFLVARLHWKPFCERQVVKPEPQDLQLLNTIKLRKLLGN